MGSNPPLFAVTTHSRLHGPRHYPAMSAATRRIRRELGDADGLVRWASVTGGPTEFWSVTLWHSRWAMQEFVRAGAHGHFMWQISSWLSSFWLMRWEPGARELGSWRGLTVAGRSVTDGATAVGGALADQVLADVPELRGAMDGSGAAAYHAAPIVRRSRRQVRGGRALLVRIHPSPLRLPSALRDVAALRRRLELDDRVARVASGAGSDRAVYLLAVCTGDAWPSAALARLASRWGERMWATEWLAEHEFGQWDGERLRTRLRRPPASVRGRPTP